jgi:hypothetical protein
MTKGNGIATAVDFRQLAEASGWTEPEKVVLPKSGLVIVLRRPTKFYWALHRTAWPAALRDKLDSAAVGLQPDLTSEEKLLLIREDQRMFHEAFVNPVVSLEPGAAQFDPSWLPREDVEFILNYLRGQVLASGQDLEQFPGSEPEAPGGSSSTGPDVQPVSVRSDPVGSS